MSPPAFDPDTDPFADAAKLLRDKIAPGTTGEPSDDMNDFPLLRDAGEPARKTNHAEDPPPAESPNEYGSAGEQSGGAEAGAASDLEVRDAGDDTEPPPPRRWLAANQFCRRFLSGLLGPGATGKTALRILQYLSLATDRALAGQHIFRRCRVLMLSFEDDGEELQRRILAARLHHGISTDEVKGWLFYATPKGVKLAEMRKARARSACSKSNCAARSNTTGRIFSGLILS